MDSYSEAKAFYANAAPVYDGMTRLGERLQRESSMLTPWVNGCNIKTALDAACGTGVYALALAGLGVKTEGSDISPEMLALAQKNAKGIGVSLPLHQLQLDKSHTLPSVPFDAVLCMGNSLPHLLDEEALDSAFDSFANTLRKDGLLLLQLVNYKRIYEQKERIVSARKAGGGIVVRLYELTRPLIGFHLLKIDPDASPIEHDLQSIQLRPWFQDELNDALNRNGFTDIRAFSSLDSQPFQPSASKDLILSARKK